MSRAVNITMEKIIRIPASIWNVWTLRRHHVSYGTNLVLNGRLVLKDHGRYKFGDDVVINSGVRYNASAGGNGTVFTVKGSLLIGNNVGISNLSLTVWDKVTIGNGVLIGSNCMISDTDFHSLKTADRTSERTNIEKSNNIKTEPVIIKDNAFIGARSIILKGVIVGENSIIGAGSVVTKDVPANEIWAGNPAKFIRKNNE